MLRVFITDPSCEEGEAYVFTFNGYTAWEDIETAVHLFYPEATEITICILPEEDDENN